MIFDNRKTVLAHKKEIHTNPGLAASNILNKIKIEEDSQLLDIKSDSIFPNEQGEFVCEKCDRAFTNKELFVKHMVIIVKYLTKFVVDLLYFWFVLTKMKAYLLGAF